jgi:hypothetical protein
MTSAARIAANRRNALASTGPRTGAGKARSAQNARRARADLYAAVAAAPGEGDRIVRLAAVGDYEQRALARRKFAIREFDAHLEWRSRKQAEPNPPRAEGIRENEPNPSSVATIRENEPNPTSVATIRENEPNPTPAAATRENEPNPMPAAGPLPVNPSGGGRHRGRELREHPGADQVAAQKAGASAPIVGGTVVSALRESPLLRLG